MKHIFTVVSLFTATCFLYAQPSTFKPDMSRALFHYKIDQAQKALLAKDGVADDVVKISDDEEVNLQLTYQTTIRIDNLQKEIDTDTAFQHNEKITYLRGIADLINNFGEGLATGKMSWDDWPGLLATFNDALHLEMQHLSILPVVENTNYSTGLFLVQNFAFYNNVGLQKSKEAIFLKHLLDNPRLILPELSRNSDNYFVDTLIKFAARRMPEELFSYAQASQTPLGRKIATSPDSLVKTIVSLSGSNSGQLYFPFLDLLYREEIKKETIDLAYQDEANYYKLLVSTQLKYAARISQGDTPVDTKGLQRMLKNKSNELYVNVINGLHEERDEIRYKSIQKLTTEELYYLTVQNEQEIYTSSYLYVYKRMFETMPVKNADSLMKRVYYDKYKKFLTMASNYNTLDDFLGKMSRASATKIITNFVNDLDKANDEDDIEDAVDVANAYAAIGQPAIKKLMTEQISRNLDERLASDNRKGKIIYRLEKLIMQSADSSSHINLADSLGILPVYDVTNNYLQDKQGRIILQMFFYGDKSGMGSFNTLLNLYSDRSSWALSSTPYWVQFTSLKTKVPFIIFANRALDEKEDKDEEAQRKLIEYMNQNDYEPSITVHRGHSYFLKYTVEKMLPSSKLVVLGSCGAYQNLKSVLQISPDAYIISSKQVGYGEINIALFTYLQEKLKKGGNINWPTMLKEVGKTISGGKKEGYDDYVFPHRNLGAIFIKAYRKAGNQTEYSMQ